MLRICFTCISTAVFKYQKYAIKSNFNNRHIIMHEPATCTLLLLAYSKSSAVKQLFVHRYRAAMKWQLRRRSVTYTTVLKPTSQPRCRRFQYQTSYVSNVKKRATTTPSHFGRAWKSINPSVRHYIVTRNAHDISRDAISRKFVDTAADRVSIYQFTQVVTTDKVIMTSKVSTTDKLVTCYYRST